MAVTCETISKTNAQTWSDFSFLGSSSIYLQWMKNVWIQPGICGRENRYGKDGINLTFPTNQVAL